MAESRLRSSVAWALATLVMILWIGLAVHGSWHHLAEGWLPGTDAYMRLLRVQRLLSGAGWFDGSIPRSNAPYGEILHWTRPLDVLLGLTARVAAPFTSGDPLIAAALVLPPVLTIAAAAGAAWMVRPLLQELATPITAVLIIGQPVLFSYGLPGRADHHVLILLTVLLLFGCVVRLLLRDSRAPALLGGLVAGFGIWVSIEAMFAYALATFLLGIAWVGGDANRWRATNLRFHASTAVVLTLAIIAERPFRDWMATYLDRLSVVHLLIAVGLVLFWTVVAPAVRRNGTVGRLAAAALAGACLAAVTAFVAPRFFLGPYASLDPDLTGVWLPRIAEVGPERLTAGRIVAHLGAPLAALAAFPLGWRRSPEQRAARSVLLLPLAVTLLLGLFQFRWLLYAEAFGAALVAVGISDISALMRGSHWQPYVRATLVVWCALGWVIGGRLLERRPTPVPGNQAATCTDAQAVAALGALPPGTVATHVDLGPAILFHTRHSVVAAPYLHNSGNRVVIDALNTPLATAKSRSFRKRGVDYVLVCPPARDVFFLPVVGGQETLYGALIRGRHPSWLTPVTSPRPGSPARAYALSQAGHAVPRQPVAVSRRRTAAPR